MELDKYGKKALNFVLEGESLFITGKAGTGKTTVLRELTFQCRRKKKNVVVLAPTGVAAKNAEGVTIHSFLHLPLGPYIPGMKNRKLYALKEEEIRVINMVDIIIIDEVSMVRCDMLDEVDDVLRHYRKSSLPFGGVQLVMFGEYIDSMNVAIDIVSMADIFVVVGTSLKVYPAAGFINYAHHEVPKFVIDPGDMEQCTQLGFTHLKTTATEGMKMLLEAFKEL